MLYLIYNGESGASHTQFNSKGLIASNRCRKQRVSVLICCAEFVLKNRNAGTFAFKRR
jgi:hypothetical protein